MTIHTISELSALIENYTSHLFKAIDDELAPKVTLVSFEVSRTMIHIRYGNEMIDLPGSIETIEQLYEKKVLLDELVANHIIDPTRDKIMRYHSVFFLQHHKIFTYVLIFDKKTLDTYYHLPEKTGMKLRSINDAIILNLLDTINDAIAHYITPQNFQTPTVSHLLTNSAKHLITEILNHQAGHDSENELDPLDKINKISSLSYEKTFSKGKILLIPSHQLEQLTDYSPVTPLIRLHEKLPLKSYRHIRKILELSDQNVYLLSNGFYLYGTVLIPQEINFSKTDYDFYTIEFNSYYSWQLNYNGNKLLQVTQEEVFTPKPKISYLHFSHELKKIFPEIETKRVLNLYKLILESLKQVKGTIIVISKNARSEANRLKNQCFIIEGKKLTPSMMKSITSIDGAVLIDLDGYCQGIGVILDGIATEKGDPSRGARYNSAIRYVETISNNPHYSACFTVVISEDGDVDMISKYSL